MWGWAATPHENAEPILFAQKTLYQSAQNIAARRMPERRPKDAKRMNKRLSCILAATRSLKKYLHAISLARTYNTTFCGFRRRRPNDGRQAVLTCPFVAEKTCALHNGILPSTERTSPDARKQRSPNGLLLTEHLWDQSQVF
jgi:hypothetical protein